MDISEILEQDIYCGYTEAALKLVRPDTHTHRVVVNRWYGKTQATLLCNCTTPHEWSVDQMPGSEPLVLRFLRSE